MIKTFILAAQFLTPLPLGRAKEVSRESLMETVPFFSVVGALQGVILFVSMYLLYRLFPYGVASGLLLLIWVLITGALHLDGLVDTIDGLMGGSGRDERLKIMSKGDAGPFGMTALFMVLLLKYLAIDALSISRAPTVLFLVPVVGKVSIVYLNHLSSYARKKAGLGKAFVDGTDGFSLSVNLFAALFLLGILLGYKGLLAFLAVVLLVYLLKRYFNSRIGGVTGDIMGATAELSETLFLIFLLI